MVQRLILLALAIASITILSGCGSSSETPVVQESAETTAKLEESKSKWTPEKQAAFKNALRRAKSGEEGGGTPGGPTTTPSVGK